MLQIPNSYLYFGSRESYENLKNKDDFTIVHFCKTYYDKESKNTDRIRIGKNIYELDSELYVNVVDEQYQECFEFAMFKGIIKWLNGRGKVFVHCDYGQSRSPSFCILCGSKILKVLPSGLSECVKAIENIQLDFVTPSGITLFLQKNWKKFDKLLVYTQHT